MTPGKSLRATVPLQSSCSFLTSFPVKKAERADRNREYVCPSNCKQHTFYLRSALHVQITDIFLQPEYNPDKPNGGNSLDEDVNAQYAGLEFHYTYLVFCAFIVWLIIPGIGLLYSGLARRKSSLALLFQSLMVCGV